MCLVKLEVILIQFLTIALVLLCIAYKRKSSAPLIAMCLLFIAFSFDEILLALPHVSLFSGLHWNWQGKIFQSLWPFILVYCLKWLAPKELGFVSPKYAMSYFYSGLFAVFFVGIAIFSSFYVGLPSVNDINDETILYEFTLPGLGEELVFRGVFLAILNKYLRRQWSFLGVNFGWGAILVTFLFMTVHLIIYDAATNTMTLTDNFIFPLLAGVILVVIREKTESIWPCVLFHNIANGLYFVTLMILI